MSSKKSVEQKYQSKTIREHILDRPGNYIGQMEPNDPHPEFVLQDGKMVQKSVSYSPAFIKIFDEILTNAIDHSIREKDVSKIKVSFFPEEGKIVVYNNGPGIEVQMHKDEKIYIPEFVFGKALTSSNYDDTEDRDWAGMNGVGASCTNIFSKLFIVETVDAQTEKKYYQEFSANMTKKTEPKITNTKIKPYTQITFFPEFHYFGMTNMDSDTLLMLEKRVYEACAILRPDVSVYLNDQKLNINGLKSYSQLFGVSSLWFDNLESKNNSWELFLGVSPDDEYHQVSFVNGIPTSQGGKHVEWVVNQIVKKSKDYLKTKYKDLTFSPAMIKNKMFLFLKAKVSNPVFTSQTKEYLATPSSKFSNSLKVSDKVVSAFIKTIAQQLAELIQMKNESKFNKEVSSARKRNLRIPKLDDAHYAGTNKSSQCSLLLVEGDSARSGVLSGLVPNDKEYVGIFALKGKVINIQKATKKQLEENTEIKNIMTILGLQKGKKYTDISSLRYGQVCITTDADEDGKHICALIVNLFRTWFPDLLKLNYVKKIKTPIVKVFNKKKKSESLSFYNLQDYENWTQNPTFSNYETKYKKGLGSLTKEDTKECFGHLEENKITLTLDDKAIYNIDMAFSKDTISDRKLWLSEYNPNEILDYKLEEIPISDLIHKELKHFSVYDNMRSIPHLMDGLKPSQRKILYACLKRNLTSTIRVSQLAGYVSEVSEYHHGEVSLQEAIVSMAQDFVGSNNLNLLFPEDQFGSRITSNDSASPRYIHTCLSKYTTKIFPQVDNPLLNYNKGDEGDFIEPEYYYPIIPMILVNGSKGIGSGFSTEIPSYNPLDLITFLKNLLTGKELQETLIPYYRNFKGQIKLDKKSKRFYTYGVYEYKAPNKIIITELPVKRWTEKYRETLNSLEENGTLKSYKDKSTDTDIWFELEFKDTERLKEMINTNSIYEQLDLITKFSLNNMNLFVKNEGTGKNEIKIFQSPEEIIKHYYYSRLSLYQKRKEYIIPQLEFKISLLDNKIRFITLYIDGTLKIQNVEEQKIIQQLEDLNFDKINDSFDYLLDMKIRILTKEQIKKLETENEKMKKEKEILEKTSPEELWIQELKELEKALEKYL